VIVDWALTAFARNIMNTSRCNDEEQMLVFRKSLIPSLITMTQVQAGAIY